MSLHLAQMNAIKIYKVWSHGRNENQCFPVDCHTIATEFGLRVEACEVGNDFQGCLIIEGNLKAILYNNTIPELGRQNFTIGHELGHYFLHRDRGEIRCSVEDLEKLVGSPHTQDIEREANLFASSLLMPKGDVLKQVAGKTINLALTSNLADRYQTTLTATACRMVEVVPRPLAVIMINEMNKVIWAWRNEYFHGFFVSKGTTINILPYNTDGYRITEFEDFGICPPGWEIIVSSIHFKNYNKALILIEGEFVS